VLCHQIQAWETKASTDIEQKDTRIEELIRVRINLDITIMVVGVLVHKCVVDLFYVKMTYCM